MFREPLCELSLTGKSMEWLVECGLGRDLEVIDGGSVATKRKDFRGV